jgi:hypothetical protein
LTKALAALFGGFFSYSFEAMDLPMGLPLNILCLQKLVIDHKQRNTHEKFAQA